MEYRTLIKGRHRIVPDDIARHEISAYDACQGGKELDYCGASHLMIEFTKSYNRL